VDVNGFKGQQFRWAKGSVQTALKLLPVILRSKYGLAVKIQAFIHLTNHAVYPLLLALALFTLPALVIHANVPEARAPFRWATFFIIASLGHPLLYLYSQMRIRSDWPRQILMLPVMIALGMGIALNNVRALYEGVAGVKTAFLRTPKYDLRTRRDGWKNKKYVVPASWLALAEVLLGFYTAIGAAYSLAHGQILVTPFLLLYSSGFLCVGTASFWHSRHKAVGINRWKSPHATEA
jgi:hypothetical protein